MLSESEKEQLNQIYENMVATGDAETRVMNGKNEYRLTPQGEMRASVYKAMAPGPGNPSVEAADALRVASAANQNGQRAAIVMWGVPGESFEGGMQYNFGVALMNLLPKDAIGVMLDMIHSIEEHAKELGG